MFYELLSFSIHLSILRYLPGDMWTKRLFLKVIFNLEASEMIYLGKTFLNFPNIAYFLNGISGCGPF